MTTQKGASKKEDNKKDVSKSISNYGKHPEEIVVKSVIPKKRQELLKWNGWGYQDSRFIVKNGIVWFTGQRYPIGDLELPHFTEWVKDTLDVDLYKVRPAQPIPDSWPEPRLSYPQIIPLLTDVVGVDGVSVEGLDRLYRAHGHTLHDIYTLREMPTEFPRIPDVVVWPTCHQHCLKLVEIANAHNLVLLPFGGGTAVSGAVECPRHETRTIISVDTSQMNRILWLDRDNLVARCQSGIVGQDLERELAALGFTSGHEPDSYEFSSLGGWVATRASGMKKNTYGNIEDLVVHVRMITGCGDVLERGHGAAAPRISCGPDPMQTVLGSEGSLGIITEVTLKVRPLPKVRRYGSVVFPDFAAGVACMRQVALERCQPASIRLMDNEQFRFGQSLKGKGGRFATMLDKLKLFYLSQVKGFDPLSMCVMTLLHEGDSNATVSASEQRINAIAARHGGIPAGESNGLRGYMLTFVIAYIRDLAMEYYVVAESFETSVPWDRTLALCSNVKRRVLDECKKRSCVAPFICCRVTQTYDAGCVVYFYFAFNYRNQRRPVEVYEEIEAMARDEIIACGGSISHHHGVGKVRKRWYEGTVSVPGARLYRAAKQALDPNNVFATANLLLDTEQVKSKL